MFHNSSRVKGELKDALLEGDQNEFSEDSRSMSRLENVRV